MRELKFRAWDGKEMRDNVVPAGKGNAVVFHGQADGFGCAGVNLKRNPWVIMQFTGLLDKNGKEIYEWDIVRNAEYKTKNISVVEWLINEVADGYYTSVGLEFNWYSKDVEVIGNIYENKELLNET